jgi:hypothetical protein
MPYPQYGAPPVVYSPTATIPLPQQPFPSHRSVYERAAYSPQYPVHPHQPRASPRHEYPPWKQSISPRGPYSVNTFSDSQMMVAGNQGRLPDPPPQAFVHSNAQVWHSAPRPPHQYDSRSQPPRNTSHHPQLTPGNEYQAISGRIHAMSQDQAGCKILQKIVKRLSQEHLEAVFQEIAPVLPLIFRDGFGNYFFQCYFEYSHVDLKKKILEIISSYLANGASDNFGTRSVQFLIAKSSDIPQLYLLLRSHLIPDLYRLCTDRYGNHCIKELITHGTFEVNKDIVDFLTSHWYEFCCHQFGNTVVQTSLRVYKAHTLPFAELIMSEALSLMQVVSPPPLYCLSLFLIQSLLARIWHTCSSIYSEEFPLL